MIQLCQQVSQRSVVRSTVDDNDTRVVVHLCGKFLKFLKSTNLRIYSR